MIFPHTGKNSECMVETPLVQTGKRSWVDNALHITEAQVTAKSGPEYLLLGYVLVLQRIFKNTFLNQTSQHHRPRLHLRNYADLTLLRGFVWVSFKGCQRAKLIPDCRFCSWVRAASAAHLLQSYLGAGKHRVAQAPFSCRVKWCVHTTPGAWA